MAWQLDIRTFLVLGALLTALIDVLLLVVWRSLPRAVRPSLRWWLAAMLIYPFAFALLGLRGQVPDLVSVVFANTLAAAAMSCNAIALRLFYGVPRRILRLAIITVLVMASSAWFVYAWPSLHWRIVATSLLMALLIGSSARAILRRHGPRGAIPLTTAVIFVGGTALIAYRAIYELATPLLVDSFFQLPPGQNWAFVLLGLLPVLSTVGFLLMCTERSQQELERAAQLDYLTGIYNRRAIEDLARRAIAASRRHGIPMAMMIVDVDHFKRINDQFGHETGDQALMETVRRLRESLRSEDLVGRLGGEEFVAILPNTDAASALAAAERVRIAFAETPMQFEDDAMTVTISAGVALLAPGDQQFSHLLRRADRAMYAAKNAGRNQVMLDGGSPMETET
ncbi:GGDEF domain-containing protein [Arenimonas sp.]|uniref:GGDEF domain-containing protein n=1 Tax=Arenimonas sp. TaxID=1872635 RepID=UPI0039E426CB